MKLVAQVWMYKVNRTTLPILMALCDSAEDDGSNCYPSPPYIRWKTSSSLATIYRVLAALEERNVLEHVGYKGDTKEYVIHLENLELKPPFERKRPGRPSKKSSQPEKGFSQREKNRTERKPFSYRENISHSEKTLSQSEKAKRRLHPSENEETTAPASKHDVADPYLDTLLITHTYDPTRARDTHNPDSFTQAGAWARTKEGQAWMAAHGFRHPDKTSEMISAWREYCAEVTA